MSDEHKEAIEILRDLERQELDNAIDLIRTGQIDCMKDARDAVMLADKYADAVRDLAWASENNRDAGARPSE